MVSLTIANFLPKFPNDGFAHPIGLKLLYPKPLPKAFSTRPMERRSPLLKFPEMGSWYYFVAVSSIQNIPGQFAQTNFRNLCLEPRLAYPGHRVDVIQLGRADFQGSNRSNPEFFECNV